MKKMIFAVMFLVAVAFNAPVCAQTQSSNNTQATTESSVKIENGKVIVPSKKKGFGPVEVTPDDKPTSLTFDWGGKTYPVYLNKNGNAFVVAEKKDGTGHYRKWLGKEASAAIREASK